MPAVTTPFDATWAIDRDGFAQNVDRLLDAGASGVVAAGCTGEFWALDRDERAVLYHLTHQVVGERGVKIVGAGGITPAAVGAAIEDAAAAGCDAALVMPPYFVRLADDDILRHFEEVDARSPLPLVLYNIPGNAGNALSPDLVGRLADLPNVVAIKESSGDWLNFYATLEIAKDRIRVFCGPSSTIGLPAVLAGCDGLIDCFPNVWPELLGLWSLAHQGQHAKAWRIQTVGQSLTELFVSEGRTLYPSTKAAMDYYGMPGGGAPRPPLRALEGAPLRGLLQGLDRLLGERVNAA